MWQDAHGVLIMHEPKDEPVAQNGEFRDFKRLLVEQARSHDERLNRLEAAKNATNIEIAVMKSKQAIYTAVIAIVSSGVVSWLVKIVTFPG